MSIKEYSKESRASANRSVSMPINDTTSINIWVKLLLENV